ncbi:hypothetical protein WKW80_19760 [Variovorax humicola]|uniref:Type VI lipase adapter protein Tla3 C-terminal domain-containing protein n=1 Tax=Variovorax humicola TaxID=1769758 RepID=A0ABU8W2M9_9BURK
MSERRARYSPWMPGQATSTALLGVIGAGLSLDQHPAHTLWAQVERAAGGRIPPPAPAGSLARCRAQAELFRAAALRGALRHWPADGDAPAEFVESYPLPTMAFAPSTPRDTSTLGGWAGAHNARLRRALRCGAGMPFHDIVQRTPVQVTTNNDFLWHQIFDSFDQADDLNSLLLWAEEGYAIRSELDSWQNERNEPLESILSRGKAASDWSDCFCALLLARSASAEWLRELSMHVHDASRVTRLANGSSARTAHAFGGLTGGRVHTAQYIFPSPTSSIKTAHVPEPWSKVQVAQYDGMPVLAWVYRPQLASYLGGDQKLLPAQSRVERLTASIRAAVDVLLQGKVPARILFDTGTGEGREQRKALLVQAVKAALPACDLFNVKVGYDLCERLGDTGAASAFVGLGLASLAAWETGATALVIGARRNDGATVLALQPMTAAYRALFKKRPYEAT